MAAPRAEWLGHGLPAGVAKVGKASTAVPPPTQTRTKAVRQRRARFRRRDHIEEHHVISPTFPR
eukprot:4094106-Prymnesium_polylepis.1